MDVSPSNSGIVEVDYAAPPFYPATSSFSDGVFVRLKAIPASGYHFDNWNGGLSGATNPTTIVIDCNKKITANFSQKMHTLTLQINGNGSTTPTMGIYHYRNGTVVSITANPDSGWQFAGWTGDVTEPDMATTMLTINSNKTVIANFSLIMHTVTIEVNGCGSTTPPIGNHSYGEGTTLSMAATPDSGWQFAGWTGDVTEPDMATTMLTINSNKTVIANFSQVKSSWWLISGIIAGVIIIGVSVWWTVRSRKA